MYKGLGLLSSPEAVSPKASPRLNLLVEWEPGYRVFFRNLFDFLLLRTVPRVKITSKPARFWHDVFVYTGVPWWAMIESGFWHLLSVLLFLVVYPIWVAHHPDLQRRPLRNSSVIYYKPLPSFPAEGGARSRPEPRAQRPQARAASGAQAPWKVARERARAAAGMAAPNVKLRGSRLPNFGGSRTVVPPVPSAAMGEARLSVPPDLASAIAPPPDLAAAGSGRRGMSGPGMAAVSPPPSLAGSAGRAGRGAAPGLGQARVVGPAPRLPGGNGRGAPGGLAGLSGGVPVVAPPPSVSRSGVVAEPGEGGFGNGGPQVVPPPVAIGTALGAGAGGRGVGFSGGNSRVVPPPPSLNGAGDSMGGGGQTASLGGGGSEVVPPPPSLTGAGGAGAGRGSSRGGVSNGVPGGSLGGATQVVPPPPSLNGAGGYGGEGRAGKGAGGLGGNGSGVVPPPPSLAGAGGNGSGLSSGGRGGSLGSGGSQAVPPPASVQTAGNFGNGSGAGAGGGAAPDISTNVAPPPPPQPADTAKADSGGEEPVRLIGLAFFLPGSSYFANYEVFLAERRLRKGQTQLIKLVYTFLPYQRRLSEYGLNASGVYKLMVRRDPSCDETLMQIAWHRTQGSEGEDVNKLVGASASRTQPLPCYRTTADDYRKALKKSR